VSITGYSHNMSLTSKGWQLHSSVTGPISGISRPRQRPQHQDQHQDVDRITQYEYVAISSLAFLPLTEICVVNDFNSKWEQTEAKAATILSKFASETAYITIMCNCVSLQSRLNWTRFTYHTSAFTVDRVKVFITSNLVSVSDHR